MSSERSIYLRKPMTRDEAKSRLAELYDQEELIFNGIIDPAQVAQSMTISAGGGSKSMTFKSESARQYQLKLIKTAIEDIECRLNGTSVPGTVIKHIEIVHK